MSFRYSPSTGGFYRTEVHGEAIPADAVYVSPARHAELMEAQGAGASITASPETGNPVIAAPSAADAGAVQAQLKAAVASEAESRIASVMPLAKQLAVLRDHVLNGTPIDQPTLDAFAEADAIQQAAEAIQSDIGSRPLAELQTYPVRSNALWPTVDQF